MSHHALAASIVALVAYGASAAMAADTKPADSRPNIVVILTDDQPLSEFNCYGGRVLSPNIDRLAREGMRFDRFYISSAVCSPSRYSCLTGRYASRSLKQQRMHAPGGPVNIGWEAGIFGEDGTLPQMLKQHGYFTGMVGKWMQGVEGRMPNPPVDADGREPEVDALLKKNYERILRSIEQCGFDFVASAYVSNVGERSGAEAKKKGWLPHALRHHNQDWVTQGALEFLDRAGDRPFFLYMPTTLTHGPSPLESIKADPRMSAAGFLDAAPTSHPSREDLLQRVREAGIPEKLAGVTWLDDGVGAVLNKLKAMGVAENTLIFLWSDNGKAGKFTSYDAGARMPCLARWPAKIKPGQVCDRLCSNIDIAPTIYDICGIRPPPGVVIDGQSILPLLTCQGLYQRPHLFLEITHERAVVSEDGYKYLAVRFPSELQAKVDRGIRHSHWGLEMNDQVHHTYNAEKLFPAYFDADQLYDLQNDPQEQANLASDPRYAERLSQLKAVLKEYSAKLPHTFGEFAP
ncbi:MAG: sulfatase [Planctomycetota bacterium]